jgi:hypothetical protein
MKRSWLNLTIIREFSGRVWRRPRIFLFRIVLCSGRDCNQILPEVRRVSFREPSCSVLIKNCTSYNRNFNGPFFPNEANRLIWPSAVSPVYVSLCLSVNLSAHVLSTCRCLSCYQPFCCLRVDVSAILSALLLSTCRCVVNLTVILLSTCRCACLSTSQAVDRFSRNVMRVICY